MFEVFVVPAERKTNVDGLVLRSGAMMQYAEWLLKNGNSTYVEKSLWPVNQLDLDYARHLLEGIEVGQLPSVPFSFS